MLGWLEILDMNAQYVVILLLYYFVYEMRLVRLQVTRRLTPDRLRKLRHKIRVERVLVMTVAACTEVALDFLMYPAFLRGQLETSFSSELSVSLWTVKGIQFLSDFYVFGWFAYLFAFFSLANLKRLSDARTEVIAIVWIVWICVLSLIEAFNLVLRDSIAPLLVFKASENTPFLQFYKQYRFLWLSISDFLLGVTILYLIYTQGVLAS